MSSDAANCGNLFTAAASTFNAIAVTVILPPARSAIGEYFLRSSSSAVMSALSCWVTAGTTFQA